MSKSLLVGLFAIVLSVSFLPQSLAATDSVSFQMSCTIPVLADFSMQGAAMSVSGFQTNTEEYLLQGSEEISGGVTKQLQTYTLL
ncbi:MAG TPA: hypothetical protein VD883_00565 [Candidatus Omnitrophota bacterium]|nr:hypothetical protein [Candidatus Omnitrophota bacterium]